MTQPGALGNAVPPGPGELVRRLQALEREVKQMQGARRLENSAVGSGAMQLHGGNITVVNGEIATRGGVIHAYDEAGHELFAAGTANGVTGVAVIRSDGTSVFDFTGGPFRILDKSGNVIFADDSNSGRGLAVPWVTLGPLANTNIATWPATTSTAWTTIASCYAPQQNPGFFWSIMGQADSGTTGNLRLTIDGTEVVRSPDITSGFYQWTGKYYFPAGWTFGYGPVLNLDAIVTAGTGTVRGQQYLLTGVQS